MARFRSRPSEIEAIQWTGDNATEIQLFCPATRVLRPPFGDPRLMMLAGKNGVQGWVEVPAGHWIVRQPGDLTDHWPVEDDYFQRKYERIEDG